MGLHSFVSTKEIPLGLTGVLGKYLTGDLASTTADGASAREIWVFDCNPISSHMEGSPWYNSSDMENYNLA